MTDAEWADWIGYHSTLFWMRTPEDALMFAAWRKPLAGYTNAELREASLWIASDQTASAAFRSRHLGLIHGRIQSRRHARRQAELDEFERQTTANQCKACSGIGLVPVPHLRCIVNGAWVYPYAEMLVACGCGLGRYRLDSTAATIAALNTRSNAPKKAFDLISIERYEAILAEQEVDWTVLVADRAASRDAHAAATAYAQQADRAQPIDVRKVLAGIGRKS